MRETHEVKTQTKRIGAALAILIAIGGWMALPSSDVQAQSGSRNGGSGTRFGGNDTIVPRQIERPFEVRFWSWLRDIEYRNWAPVPGQGAGHYEGKSPHGDLLKMYVNRTAAGNMKELPNGSILVKENFNKDKQLMAVTVMYRSTGYDAQHNDWYYAKYDARGQIQFKGTTKLAGRVKGCIDCHAGADGDDYVFAND